jgi:hypothetical protein
MSQQLWEHLPALWWIAWEEWERIGHGILETQGKAESRTNQPFTNKILRNFVLIFREIYVILKFGFFIEDVSRLLDILYGLAALGRMENYYDTSRMDGLQQAVMQVVKELDLSLEGSPHVVIEHLMDTSCIILKTDGSSKKAYVPLTCTAVKEATRVFEAHVDKADLAHTITTLSKILCFCYSTEDIDKESKLKLKQIAQACLVVVFEKGIHAFPQGDSEARTALWKSISMSLSNLSTIFQTNSKLLEHAQQDTATFFQLFKFALAYTDTTAVHDLVSILYSGIHLYEQPKHRACTWQFGNDINAIHSSTTTSTARVVADKPQVFAFACLKVMFSLCSQQAEDMQEDKKQLVAQSVAPTLFDYCKTMLCYYIADKQLLGSIPMQKYSPFDYIMDVESAGWRLNTS